MMMMMKVMMMMEGLEETMMVMMLFLSCLESLGVLLEVFWVAWRCFDDDDPDGDAVFMRNADISGPHYDGDDDEDDGDGNDDDNNDYDDDDGGDVGIFLD